MKAAISQSLQQFEHELFIKMLGKAPIEERLRGLLPEEVLRALPAEFVAGLSAEEAARLRELLERKQGR